MENEEEKKEELIINEVEIEEENNDLPSINMFLGTIVQSCPFI